MFKGGKIYTVTYRIYLELKYEESSRAKSYGCLWDSRIHKWYFYEDDYMKSGIKNNSVLRKELCPYMILNDTNNYV